MVQSHWFTTQASLSKLELSAIAASMSSKSSKIRHEIGTLHWKFYRVFDIQFRETLETKSSALPSRYLNFPMSSEARGTYAYLAGWTLRQWQSLVSPKKNIAKKV